MYRLLALTLRWLGRKEEERPGKEKKTSLELVRGWLGGNGNGCQGKNWGRGGQARTGEMNC